MIITISLVSIYYYILTIFFLVLKTLKYYSLSNFQIYNTVLLTIVTMLYITSPDLFCNWKCALIYLMFFFFLLLS